uniref:ABC transmembrane type-1 domain-containing protein n=1 Tax=Tetranychus urticae TaxID=32264 RepID=T1K2L8_TETUR
MLDMTFATVSISINQCSKDLWSLADYLKSDFLLEKLKSKDKSLKLEALPSTKSSVKTSKDSVDKQKVNVVLLLFKTFGHYLLFGACLKLVQDILTFLTPELLKVLLNFIENQSSEPIWHGFFIAIVLFSPLQVIIALWLLYRELGYSSLFGAFVMLVMGPLDGIVVKYSEKFQEKIHFKDTLFKNVCAKRSQFLP